MKHELEGSEAIGEKIEQKPKNQKSYNKWRPKSLPPSGEQKTTAGESKIVKKFGEIKLLSPTHRG